MRMLMRRILEGGAGLSMGVGIVIELGKERDERERRLVVVDACICQHIYLFLISK
jgi:hypothetical protein